jgi:hypothetical protein
LSRKNINDQAVIKPKDMENLGYRHIEQIQILSALQDFKLDHQSNLLNADGVCQKCNNKTTKFGIRKSKFHAVLTDHEVSIQRMQCRCGWVSESTVEGIYGSSIHPELLEKQVKQSSENSYRKSKMHLNAESGDKRPVNNTERLRRTVDKVANVIENNNLKEVTETPNNKAAKELIAVVDGGHIKSVVKESRSFEAMIGSVYRPENLIRVDKHHNEITKKTSVASALSDEQKAIKTLILNACKKEGMNTGITKLTCLTDGANNCWSITKTLENHCHEFEQILDWFHITKRFTIIKNSIGAALEDRLDKAKWHLWHGDHKTALIRINQLKESVSTDRLILLLTDLHDYIHRNQAYLTNYQVKSASNLPYTSTYAEVSVNSIINTRQKFSQKMQWGRTGAHNILQIRASIYSKTWKKDFEVAKKEMDQKAA